VIRLKLHEYDPAWAQQFEEHRERIAAALGGRAKRIEHIGSTAVPGLAAKPIVDIIVDGVTPDDPHIRAALEDAGYHVTVDEREHCIYEPPALDVHVHLWSDPAQIERHIVFRDWLRANPQDRRLYEAVKRRLTERLWKDSNDYAQAKTPVIRTILRRASGERHGQRAERFAQTIAAHVIRGGKVLEIGAGECLLAQRLCTLGYDVTALDPELRTAFPIVLTTFELFDAPELGFDCVAAQLVLHHATDLGRFLAKAERLLKPRGILAIDDYGWERSGDPKFRAERSELHTSQAMLSALNERFAQVEYGDHAYFHEGAGEDRLGFTWIGARIP
jgi:GrpB-like predicted nucleotidyltransferase (UPF0157 family)